MSMLKYKINGSWTSIGLSTPVDSTPTQGSLNAVSSGGVYDMIDNTSMFKEVNLGTWSSKSQVDTFLSAYTHNNGYKNGSVALNLGNYVTIQDGTYNVEWMIAGFDTEYNKGDTATGYGITLIPRTIIMNSPMNDTDTTTGGYAGSKMHTVTLPAIATELQKVLGTHLISRRVYISDVVTSGSSSSWKWDSAYCTLMSEIQIFGAKNWGNGYDVGEACQKLPIFNHVNHNQYSRATPFWLRGVGLSTSFVYANSYGLANYNNASLSLGVRPLIYIR